MLVTAKEETHLSPALGLVPDWHQADPPFSGENAVELPDDNNGNLIQKTNNTTSAFTLYEYDAENKLIRVVRDDGSIVNYKYDGLGRRIEKEVDSVVTQYIYDNEDILLELDGSNSIVARYTHGPGIDEPLVMEKNGVSSFYHADGLGSITELTDNSGTIVQSYTYSSFGKIQSQLDPIFVQPYTFTGREVDPETGFYFYRSRYYDHRIGRFISEDPIGFRGGVNFYAYTDGNPTTVIDPFANDAIHVTYRGYMVNTGMGFRAPLGHAGVVAVNELTGHTEYYEYGRYDPAQFGVVRRRPIPDVDIEPDGRPTEASLQRLYDYISQNYGQGRPVRAQYYDDADFQRVVEFATGRMNDPNRDPYGILTNNCYTFAREAVEAGRGPRAPLPRQR